MEGYGGRDHETLEQQRQGRLAARQTAVEEADAGDDGPHDDAAERNVHGLVF